MQNPIVRQQIHEWSRLYGRTISPQEYDEICHNLNGFFSTLKLWSDDEERMLTENAQTNDKRSDVLSPTSD